MRVTKDICRDTFCKKNFSCLSGNHEHLCKVDSTVGAVIFVKRQLDSACKYCLSYGNSYVCTCPTRKEIYSENRV